MSKKLYELPLGLYEKALPAFDPKADAWRAILTQAKQLGFSFVEMSIDESDDRLARLQWTKDDIKQVLDAKHITDMRIPSICLSCHRATPFGSASKGTRSQALDIMKRAVDLADALGVRVIQLAGYDVYYEKDHDTSLDYFLKGLQQSVAYAAHAQVMLGMEIMDTAFMNSVSKFLAFKHRIPSPWFGVYPDVGNISAWNTHTAHELIAGITHTVAIHLKDTYRVTQTSAGQFRDVPFGTGCVDFNAVFHALQTAQYQGPFLIEMWAHNNQDITVAREQITQAKTWLITKMKEVYI